MQRGRCRSRYRVRNGPDDAFFNLAERVGAERAVIASGTWPLLLMLPDIGPSPAQQVSLVQAERRLSDNCPSAVWMPFFPICVMVFEDVVAAFPLFQTVF